MDFLAPLNQMTPRPVSLQGLQQNAIAFASRAGFPSRKDEGWRYTSVKAITDGTFQAVSAEEALSHQALESLSHQLAEGCDRIVFVNGFLNRTLSTLENLPSEIKWSSQPDRILSRQREQFDNSFQALNVAYVQQGIWLQIPADFSLPRPLQIHFHIVGDAGPLMIHPRVVVEVGARSVARILESYSSQTGRHFSNSITQVVIGEGARILHVRSQQENLESLHLGETAYELGASSELTSLVISTGARLARHHLRLPLERMGIKARVLGLSVSTGDQHLDHTTDIDHTVGGCDSEQIYKSLLDHQSRTVFNGRIYIRPQAQKANSSQLNNNVLLSSRAEADSQPQLMIEADDVKAAHGSTVGHLNAEELFYLQSRGIPRRQAVPLLAFGFLADLLETIDHDGMKSWLTQRLKESFDRLNTEAL